MLLGKVLSSRSFLLFVGGPKFDMLTPRCCPFVILFLLLGLVGCGFECLDEEDVGVVEFVRTGGSRVTVPWEEIDRLESDFDRYSTCFERRGDASLPHGDALRLVLANAYFYWGLDDRLDSVMGELGVLPEFTDRQWLFLKALYLGTEDTFGERFDATEVSPLGNDRVFQLWSADTIVGFGIPDAEEFEEGDRFRNWLFLEDGLYELLKLSLHVYRGNVDEATYDRARSVLDDILMDDAYCAVVNRLAREGDRAGTVRLLEVGRFYELHCLEGGDEETLAELRRARVEYARALLGSAFSDERCRWIIDNDGELPEVRWRMQRRGLEGGDR